MAKNPCRFPDCAEHECSYCGQVRPHADPMPVCPCSPLVARDGSDDVTIAADHHCDACQSAGCTGNHWPGGCRACDVHVSLNSGPAPEPPDLFDPTEGLAIAEKALAMIGRMAEPIASDPTIVGDLLAFYDGNAADALAAVLSIPDHPCVHGHYDCARTEGGECSDEHREPDPDDEDGGPYQPNAAAGFAQEPDPWAIAPVGTLRGDAHYPSAAELAAFRRSIGPIDGTPERHPRGDNAIAAAPGAFTHERTHGIGYRVADDPGRMIGWLPSSARREASALRSRAYAEKGMRSTWLVPVDPRGGGAWYAEVVDGAPYQWHRLGR